MAKVYAINVSPARGERLSLREATLIKGKGIAEDRHSGGDRQVSLMAMEALDRVKELKGLCTGRFSANILTQELDYHALHIGDILNFGDCAIELSEVGKPCHEQCELLQVGRGCPLPDACAFGRVVYEGKLRVGVPVLKSAR